MSSGAKYTAKKLGGKLGPDSASELHAPQLHQAPCMFILSRAAGEFVFGDERRRENWGIEWRCCRRSRGQVGALNCPRYLALSPCFCWEKRDWPALPFPSL